jgi:hypothetical protein
MATRDEIIKRVKAQRQEIKQFFLDIEHWNRINPGKKPIDPDPDGILKKFADSFDRLLVKEGECGCCDRVGEYNGFGSDGPTKFTCPNHCPCHD